MTGVLCPACGSAKTDVKDSRPQPGGWRRRRRCACGHRFTTMELVVDERPRVVQQVPVVGGSAMRVVPLDADVLTDDMKRELAARIAAQVNEALGLPLTYGEVAREPFAGMRVSFRAPAQLVEDFPPLRAELRPCGKPLTKGCLCGLCRHMRTVT